MFYILLREPTVKSFYIALHYAKGVKQTKIFTCQVKVGTLGTFEQYLIIKDLRGTLVGTLLAESEQCLSVASRRQKGNGVASDQFLRC